MRTHRIQLIRAVGLGLLVTSCSAWSLSYSATSVSATVVDAESGRPLEGVNVTINWQLEDINMHWEGDLFTAEEVTDQDGRFQFPAWGPKSVDSIAEPPGAHGGYVRRLGSAQPTIALFKSGYPIEAIGNEWDSSTLDKPLWTGKLLRSSDWNNKAIKMTRFNGTEKEYMRTLMLQMATGYLPAGICPWARIPRMTAALMNEAARHSQSVSPFDQIQSLQDLEKEAKQYNCASPREVLGPYLK